MAKGKKKEAGEQLQLIEVGPKDGKEILAAAKIYKKHQKARLAAAAKEADQKTLILELVDKADLQRLAGGVIKFEIEGIPIKITPRDQLVQVGEAKEATE